MFKFRSLPQTYKIVFAISVFFLVNMAVSMNIGSLPSFSTYIIGFSVGVLCSFLGLAMQRKQRKFDATDLQMEISLDLCNQLSAMPVKVSKGLPPEIIHIVYAAKAYFGEANMPMNVVVDESPKTQTIIAV